MSLLNIGPYFYGYVVIKVEGETIEKFVNLVVQRGINIWDIERSNERLFAKIHPRDYGLVCYLVRKAGCTIQARERGGLPFIWSKLWRRKMLIFGAVFSLVTIYILSSYVWFIEIKGQINLTQEQILQAAQEVGLKPGVPKRNLNYRTIEDAMLDKLPQLAWVGISVTGTKATLEIAEKAVVEVPEKTPCDLVATKDGLISEIIVLQGQSAVRRGQTVKKGQTLISGTILPPPDPNAKPDQPGATPPVPQGEIKFVHAQGIIKARVWYQAYGEAYLHRTVKQRTGAIYTVKKIKLKDLEFVLEGRGAVPFNEFETEQQVKKMFSWRNLQIPVEVIIVNYYELSSYDEPITYEQAREEAVRVALQSVMTKIPAEEVEILEKKVEEIRSGESNIARVKVMIETLEDISMPQPINH